MSAQSSYRCLVSACLCGESCRYDGGHSADARFTALAAAGLALPVCPERLGGLPVPRRPCEIKDGRVLDASGEDHTGAFRKGAASTLALAREHGIRTAVLKARSPSCGSDGVYDGGFSGRLVPGKGVCAALLEADGIAVYSEENCPDRLTALPG